MPAFWSSFSGSTVSSALAPAGARPAARHDAFFHGRSCGVQGVFNPVLSLLHLDFGRGSDVDDRDTAGELGQPFLQLLFVVVGGRFLDLRLDLIDAGLNVLLLAGAFNDCRSSFLIEARLTRPSMSMVTFSSLKPRSSAISVPAVTVRDIFEHGLSPVAKPGL